MPGIAREDNCPSRDPIKDTEINAGSDVDKYALEMSTTLKKYRIWMAKGAKENINMVAQNIPLFGFIHIYGLKAVSMMLIIMVFAVIFCNYIASYVQMVGIITELCKSTHSFKINI